MILWTCRVGDMLQKAVEWCKERNLVFDAVNENLPEIIESFGSDTRKIFANEYIDDRNTWPQKNDVADILYLCDGKSCGDTCPGTLGTGCKHTSDISHAKNLQRVSMIPIGRKKPNPNLKILVLMRNPVWNYGQNEKWNWPANAKHLIRNQENGIMVVLALKVP